MEDITRALTPPAGEKYGPTGDGGYNTPFAVTVFYREDKLYQLAIAALSEMCQAIPVGGDLMLLGEACEHPSPELIIFDDNYTPEHIQKYFQRGFQKIRIFANGDESPICSLSKIDPRVSTFTTANMHDGNLKLIGNLNAVYIVELVMCGTFPEYQSFIRGINNSNGVTFIGYIQRTLKTPGDVGRKLINIALLMNGYEKVEEMCHQYNGMKEERKILASERIASSPTIDGKLYVYCADLRNELIRESATVKAKYIVLWFIRSDFKVCASVVKGSAWTESDPTPLELIKPFCTETETALDCVLSDKSFIPIG